jgi:hypothetical protein
VKIPSRALLVENNEVWARILVRAERRVGVSEVIVCSNLEMVRGACAPRDSLSRYWKSAQILKMTLTWMAPRRFEILEQTVEPRLAPLKKQSDDRWIGIYWSRSLATAVAVGLGPAASHNVRRQLWEIPGLARDKFVG